MKINKDCSDLYGKILSLPLVNLDQIQESEIWDMSKENRVERFYELFWKTVKGEYKLFE